MECSVLLVALLQALGQEFQVYSGVGSFFSGVFNGARNAVSGAFSAFGQFAANAYNAITGVFSGIGSFFSGIFNRR